MRLIESGPWEEEEKVALLHTHRAFHTVDNCIVLFEKCVEAANAAVDVCESLIAGKIDPSKCTISS